MAPPSRDSEALQTFSFQDVGLLATWKKLKMAGLMLKEKLLAKN